MQASFSLGAIAFLLSGSSLAIPALADSTLANKTPLLASAQVIQPTVELEASTDVAIRDVQSEVAPEPVIRPVVPAPVAPAPRAPRVVQVSSGRASWYGPGFFGNRTANGEVFRPGTMTAAHRTLPFGTKVRVTNLSNGRTAVVRINDRGPFIGNRVIDLAHGAAQHLGLVASGLAPVRLEVLR
jgi:rare lipoprotein A